MPAVIAALNGKMLRLTSKQPSEAIKARSVAQKPSSVDASCPVGLEEPLLSSSAVVRYLVQPVKVEGKRRKAIDLVWSLKTHTVRKVVRQRGRRLCTISMMPPRVVLFPRSC